MFSRFFRLFAVLTLAAAPLRAAETGRFPPPDWQLSPVAATQKLTARAPGELEAFRAAPVRLSGARGEWVNFQFVVTAGAAPIERIEVERHTLASIAGDFLAPQSAKIFRENYVFVAQPSGNRDLQPKWWPDALLPLELAPRGLGAKQSAVFWISFQVPKDAAPATYYGQLDVKCDGETRHLALDWSVENRDLPAPRTRATVAVYYDVLRDWYRKNGEEFSDAAWREQKKRFYDFLLDYNFNAYDLPVAWDDPAAETYLRDPRVLSVRTPELGASDFALALQKLRATGTLSKAFYYRFDEPTTPEQFAQIRQIAPRLRALGIKQLVTVHPNLSLKDAVDIWCPNLGDFFGINHLSAPQLENERKTGRETWFYTMVEPKFPLPTWLLDDDASAISAFGPLMQRYGFSGFVYSMAHGWGPKPLENLTSYAGTSGDGTLLYPAEIVGGVGPMPSMRLMLLRDLIEDISLNRVASAPLPAPVMLSLPLQTRLEREGAPTTDLSVRLDAKKRFLVAHFRAEGAQNGDYVAVELAPLDLEKSPEKWRFVATRKGNLRVEKWTREGRFELENSGFSALIHEVGGVTNTEMRVPLTVLNGAASFHCGALRRATVSGAKITIYAQNGDGDPALMPILRVR